MKAWVFVEGESDRLGLEALWGSWQEKLRETEWSIRIVPLDDKSRFFRKIGHRAAEKLVGGDHDIVVGLPDLYPNAPYNDTEYRHSNLDELEQVQIRLVEHALRGVFSISDPVPFMQRFHPAAFKHDMEMLLLAAQDQLRTVLKTESKLGKWRHPIEEQNQNKPPKRVVEELFLAHRKRAYRDTVDAKAVLEKVGDLGTLLYNASKQLECPVFKSTLDWIATQTGIAAY